MVHRPLPPLGTLRLGVVILTFHPDPVSLRSALHSVLASEGFGATISLVDVLVADNGSNDDVASGAISELKELGNDRLRLFALPQNLGFAGGTNAAIARLDPSCNAVFLLNDDATLASDTMVLCAKTLLNAPEGVVSVAPKMLLDGHQRIIDAVGNSVNRNGEGANIGLGQPDLGQFDSIGEAFGPCFGATLIRRDAFDVDQVGPLDERLFLYYEDVDWNWRAQLLGYSSLRQPQAEVVHQMSGSSRHLPYDFKFRYTERNLLLTVLKCSSWPAVRRIWFGRVVGLLLGSVKGHYPKAGLHALAGAVIRIPSTLRLRRNLQARRVRTDQEMQAYGEDNKTFFDPVRYEPSDQIGAQRYARLLLRRLAVRVEHEADSATVNTTD